MRTAFFLCAGLLAGCTVGPDYQRPVLPSAHGDWLNPVSAGEVEARWWTRLGDPQLDALVDSALARNLDVREAQARLREARANRDAAVGRAFPDLRVTGSVAEQQLSANGQLPVANISGGSREF